MRPIARRLAIRTVISTALLGLFVAGWVFLHSSLAPVHAETKSKAGSDDWQIPNPAWKTPWAQEQPILFVTRASNAAEWDKLPAFWNETTSRDIDPLTGKEVERKVVKIRVPLGLGTAPAIPPENPMTVAKVKLGKQLYFDPIISSNNKVSCATCHDPAMGYTDQSPVSTGINGNKGGMSAPTVYNSAYSPLQFWDGRAPMLEDQCQGPPGNPLEMWDGKGNAWGALLERVRARPDYVAQFRSVFGTEPTRDGAAKAIAAYERTVLTGNSIHDRAELVMRARVEEEGLTKFETEAKDYLKVLKEAFAKKNIEALTVLKLDPVKDEGKIEEMAKSIANGRALYFGKARCNSCHVGENFTDGQFHNLGVGVKDGKLPEGALGRFGSQAPGHKNPELVGAFKTPTLRQVASTAPYMHDGSEKTLEEVIEFYNRGGNANEFLSNKMRDYDAEKAWLLAKEGNRNYEGPPVQVFNGKPIVPLKLNLTPQEVKDVANFVRSLEGDAAPAIVADPATALGSR